MRLDVENVSDKNLEQLDKILRQINLPKGQWVLWGSAVMTLHGIEYGRSFGDVDIFLSTRAWLDLQKDPSWTIFSTNPNDPERRSDPPFLYKYVDGVRVDVFPNWRNRYDYDNFNVSELITNAEIVKGWPCVPLKHIIDFKIGRFHQRGAYKDLLDADLIKAHLGITIG